MLIRNAMIYDGSGKDGFYGDVRIKDDKICEVGTTLRIEADEAVVDVQGKSLAPGFIDIHSHNDWFAIRNDPLPYFDPFIRQGITTFVGGNCGLSAIGFENDSRYIDKMGGGLFSYRDTIGCYGDFASYAQATDGAMPCNLALLVGHCSARAAVSGSANRELTEQEEAQMLAIMEKALQQGAAGISLGLMYDPGMYAQKEELKKVAQLCIKYNKPLTVHSRANSAVSMAYPELLGRSHLLRALDELADIARGTNLKLQYSHAIFVGRRSFKDKDAFLQIMSDLRSQGVDAMFDVYNEMLGVSVITVILPTWYQAMSAEEKKKPLNRLKLSLLVYASSLLLGFGFKDIQVAYIGAGYEHYEGKTVHEIARAEGLSDLDAYLMLCEKSNFKGRVNMGPYSTPDILRDFEHHEHCLFMTDAWVEEHGVQNPAIYDCYPKFLRDSILGIGAALPATIRKMTGASADRFSLKDRGYIREGCYADLVVFDEDAIRKATPDQECSFGIEQVFINGKKVLDNGELNKTVLKTSGMALRV